MQTFIFRYTCILGICMYMLMYPPCLLESQETTTTTKHKVEIQNTFFFQCVFECVTVI